MRQRTHRTIRLAVVAVLAVVATSLFAGCANDTSTTSNAGPAATATPSVPNIAGHYIVNFTMTTNGSSANFAIQMQIDQTGHTLTGTVTNSAGITTTLSGAISNDSSLTISYTWPNLSQASILVGSVVGPGHLAGTAAAEQGTQVTWDAHH
jgi:hypothetical protein